MSCVLAIASGKGGVGKTFLACTLGQALCESGRATLLFDADLGLANVDIQLGIDPPADLFSVVRNGMPLASAVLRHEATGLDLVVGRSGSGSLAGLGREGLRGLLNELASLARRYDFALLDLAAGLEAVCRAFARLADRVLVVTTDEPTALTDAYAFIKVACARCPEVAVIVNQVGSERRGRETFDVLARACERFLGRRPVLAGVVRRDPRVAEAVRAQQPLLHRYPAAPAAEDIRGLALWLASRPVKRSGDSADGPQGTGPLTATSEGAPQARRTVQLPDP